jgi:polyhydroxyalkanoate synthesis repressor PhaR
MIIIKKYRNRRLYDTRSSKYINLEDLYELIKSNVEFKVIEAGSDKDITRTTLIQVIFEFENREYDLLPQEFLKFIIRMQGHPLNEVFIRYLEQLMNQFKQPNLDVTQFSQPDYSEIMKQYYESMESGLEIYKQFYQNLTGMSPTPENSNNHTTSKEEQSQKYNEDDLDSSSSSHKDKNSEDKS